MSVPIEHVRRRTSWDWRPARESDEHDILHQRAPTNAEGCDCTWTKDGKLCHDRHDAAAHTGNDQSFCWRDCCEGIVTLQPQPPPPPSQFSLLRYADDDQTTTASTNAAAARTPTHTLPTAQQTTHTLPTAQQTTPTLPTPNAQQTHTLERAKQSRRGSNAAPVGRRPRQPAASRTPHRSRSSSTELGSTFRSGREAAAVFLQKEGAAGTIQKRVRGRQVRQAFSDSVSALQEQDNKRRSIAAQHRPRWPSSPPI